MAKKKTETKEEKKETEKMEEPMKEPEMEKVPEPEIPKVEETGRKMKCPKCATRCYGAYDKKTNLYKAECVCGTIFVMAEPNPLNGSGAGMIL